jgi:FtsP/CotA-like multicopper oxidase with cupredoxin domain
MTGATVSATMATGCQDIETQIYDGLSGTIIVGDDRALLPSALGHVTTRTLALKDMQITSSGHIVANTPSYSISSDNPTVRLINGQLQPVLDMRPGQTELWRIANEGADIAYDLQLPGFTFTIVGRDGCPVSKVTSSGTLALPPAARWDVLVTASTSPGSTWLENLSFSNGPEGDSYPTVNLMKVSVAGQPEPPLPMPTGALPTAVASLATAHIAASRVVRLSQSANGAEMYINGKQFNPDASVFSTPAILGTTEEWTILNETGEFHPFHTHTEHFQVMSVNGVPQPYTGEQDIVSVPNQQNGKPGEVVIRIHFTDFTGKVMFHCHISAHEDAGMMSYVNVIAPAPAQLSTRR